MSSDKSQFYYVAPCAELSIVDLVRCRAYELFEERGRRPGHDMDDWLRAEREVNQRLNSLQRGVSYEAIET